MSAAHFAWVDHVVCRWRAAATGLSASSWRAAATGALAVSGPFAWWPDRAGPLLGRLGVPAGQWELFTAGAQLVFTFAAIIGVLAIVAAVIHRDVNAALEPVAVATVTVALPPLLGFAVYFVGWHAWRQTVRLVAVHPAARQWLRQGSVATAAAVVVRRACLPTTAALAAVGALVLSTGDASAAVLVALLAVSVPHAVVTVLTEWRPNSSRPDADRATAHTR